MSVGASSGWSVLPCSSGCWSWCAWSGATSESGYALDADAAVEFATAARDRLLDQERRHAVRPEMLRSV